MVTTRRSAQQPLSEEDEISSDASSIPAETPPRRRASTIGAPSTLRPSREPAASNTGPAKRKHCPGATTEGPQLKRQRSPFDVRDTIEVQGEDDDVDAAIKATSLRPASRIEVCLPSGRLSREGNRTISVGVPSDGSIADITGPRRLRARRLKRQEHEPDSDSSRVQRGHAAKMVQEGVLRGAAPRGSRGSRGLQPSSPTKPPADIYDIPSDGDSDQPNPAPARASRTINNRQTQRRRKPTGTSPRRPHSPIRDVRLSSTREEKQSQSATVTASRREAHRTASGRGSNAGPPRLGEEVQDSEDEIGPEGGRSTGRDAEESVDTGATEESDGSESDEATRGPRLEGIQVRPYRDNEPTILAYSEHLSNMLELMGRRGWTEAGRRWMKLCSIMPDSDEDSPARTRLGRRILNDLGRLNDELDDIPNALDLGQQSQALASRQQALNGAISSVDKTVRKIERRAGPAPDGQGSQSGSRLFRRLADDLTKCVIPMLVLVLRTAFAIGVDEPDAEATDSTPPRGAFTWTTVQYLMVILAWLSRLRRLISGNPSPAAEGTETFSAQQRADPDDAKQNRERFGVIVRKWIQQLRHEVDTYNQQADLRLARHQMKQRDRKVREQRQREEEVEMAAARLQEEAFRLSMQQMASKPRPLAEKFYKATEHWGLPPAGSGDTSGARNPTPSAPRSSSSSMFLTPAPARQQSALPSPVLGDRPWSEWEIDTFL
ncbi:hypothetical protein MYCTH_102533 [Thermothelomyces thermophilus ATCC 42464]|uniref:Uncharacterized protein n=1 Tax=Thermothelomyces thermophilus (strain ATCC 42464 / BCRC 31852 / DSM 1799) TaxID=573729 RepID=G2QF37_THET4|nr:uncharacterized protein MYCTH_102533 [Thermothelomyces thermophilus ATCC 42464]AEO59066.1 hypothetical protein MYCTH_102533 [Thermothelomyces thermophilus ATCC 42464]